MIESLRWPRMTPSSDQVPKSSGPRCRSVVKARSNVSGLNGCGPEPAQPRIPHTSIQPFRVLCRINWFPHAKRMHFGRRRRNRVNCLKIEFDVPSSLVAITRTASSAARSDALPVSCRLRTKSSLRSSPPYGLRMQASLAAPFPASPHHSTSHAAQWPLVRVARCARVLPSHAD